MLDKLKLYLESIKITPISWLLGISGVLMVRFFLESLSNPTSSGYFASDASTLIHYYLFFMCAFVANMIILQFAVPSWKKASPQFIAATSLFIFIAPIADWIISGGEGFKMTYFFDIPRDMLIRFLTFGGTNLYVGATIGLRIEIALMLLLFGVFVYLAQKNWKRAIISYFVLYLTVLTLASIPGIISAIGQTGHLFQNNPITFFQNTVANSSTISNNLHSSLEYSSVIRLFEISFNFIMGKVLFLILIVLASFWFHSNFREKFKSLIGDYRSNRTTHYFLMIFLGLFSAYTIFPTVKFNWNDWLSLIMLCLSFYFSIRFAVCTNDIVDEEIDVVTNIKRPLVAGSLSQNDMKQASAVFLLATLISGFLVGYTTLFFVLTFTALYYIYSAPPTRYKLIPFFSSFIIGLCSLSAVIAGFFLLSPIKQVSAFPDKLIMAVVLLFFLHSHIRDIKDIEGDKRVGIPTVPVIFGDFLGPKVVGFLSSLAFILVPFFMSSNILFLSAIPAALLNYYFVNKKPYVENPIFKTYFAFVLVSLILLAL